MNIRDVQTTIVSIPVRHRIVSAVREADRVINVLVEVRTDEGVSGVAYVAGFTAGTAVAVRAMIDELAGVIAGQDATATGALWERMRAASRLAGLGGLPVFALSAIDLALWDLQGKRLGVPVHRLLGSYRTMLPAYASDGCWLHDDPARVAEEAAAFASQGFGAIKVRFGRRDPADDFAALDAVRRAVGDGVRLMVDVNQGWDRQRALAQGRRLAGYDLAWFEEPVAADDVEGLAELRRELPMAIVAGENSYLPAGMRALVEARAVSVLMPDVQRVGGITGWIRASAIAEAWRLPITSHLFPEISAHLLAASSTAHQLEWVSWMEPLLAEPLPVTNGVVTVPERPGLGIAFDADAVRAYQLDA